ncbi:MAG: tetratricopeptide repeat protein [Deltaproteobacteria bacterium]|nr:tetratricopeptide repeat protein [Deltaproteobacteria bacterium]
MGRLRLLALITICGFVTIYGAYGCSKGEKDTPKSGAENAPAPRGNEAQSSVVIEGIKSELAKKPDDPALMQSMGDAYFENHQYNEALTYYKLALEKKPGDATLYNEIGLCLTYLNNPAEGLRYIEEGIKKNPYHQRIWLTKGFILSRLEDDKGSKAALERAVALNPDSDVGRAAAQFLAADKDAGKGKKK